MLYGLCGSSGTGKTTLAKAVAESLCIEFMPTSITASAKKHGFDAVGLMTTSQRIALQWCLLHDHLEMLEKAPRPLIVDRTPIDMLSYMLAEVDMFSHMRLTPEQILDIENYKEACLKATARFYDHVFVTCQLPTYEISSTRPAANRAYQTHSQLLMEGALYSIDGLVNFSVMRTADPDERHDHVHDTIVTRLNEIEAMRKSCVHFH